MPSPPLFCWSVFIALSCDDLQSLCYTKAPTILIQYRLPAWTEPTHHAHPSSGMWVSTVYVRKMSRLDPSCSAIVTPLLSPPQCYCVFVFYIAFKIPLRKKWSPPHQPGWLHLQDNYRLLVVTEGKWCGFLAPRHFWNHGKGSCWLGVCLSLPSSLGNSESGHKMPKSLKQSPVHD